MTVAVTRAINSDMGHCELTYLPRVVIDMQLAVEQHSKYQSALSNLGYEVLSLPTGAGLPDSVFVEDTALVLDEIAVICRPGTTSRRSEVAGVRTALKEYRELATIEPPGTLEGGDLLRLGKVIYAGLSTRSNLDGIEQLSRITAEYGYAVKAAETHGCLHLKSAVSSVAPGVLLINGDWIDRSIFKEYELIDIDEREAHAANALLVGQGVIYPTSFPRTLDRLNARSIDVIPVDVSELQKAEGAVTCCSLIL